ncbi:gamma carbonic anhydrase family protein [Oceanobacillus halotolerans]|uniref:gamma carbonic anhydrase family protein n=1 Tax=Oceanobacillus halotolerans TaxID=2663380 RepID=UPI001CF7749B|nr:gamma carbonic anhydrase family protein [Oceanobacillus halotolerans]
MLFKKKENLIFNMYNVNKAIKVRYSIKKGSPIISESTYIALGAKVIGHVKLEKNTSIWFNAILRGDNDKITVDNGSNIQDGAVIHVDPGYPVNIGKHVTIGHNAIIHGCTIKDNSLVGMGATILNGAVVGEGSLVAANALIPEGEIIDSGALVAGVPARKVRDLSEIELRKLKETPNHYIDNAILYSDSLE